MTRLGKATMNPKRTSRLDLLILRAEGAAVDNYDRPQTRGDCLAGGMNAQRPCPWSSCRHHMLLHVNRNGSVTLDFGHDDVEQLKATCALDLIDEHGAMTLEYVGECTGVTRERLRQIEEEALSNVPAEGLALLAEWSVR